MRLSPHRKLALARELLSDAIRASRPAPLIVALSYGKDSLAVLDLAHAVGAGIPGAKLAGFFLYLVPGLRCIAEREAWVRARYGIPPVPQLPHIDIPRFLTEGRGRMPVYAAAKHELTIPALETRARELLGDGWIASGHRKQDSLQRRGMLSSLGKRAVKSPAGGFVVGPDGARVMVPDGSGSRDSFNAAQRRVYPLSEWVDADVRAYLAQRRVRLPVQWDGNAKMSGIELTRAALLGLAARYPDDLERIFRVFPHARGLILSHAPAHEHREEAPISEADRRRAGYGEALRPSPRLED